MHGQSGRIRKTNWHRRRHVIAHAKFLSDALVPIDHSRHFRGFQKFNIQRRNSSRDFSVMKVANKENGYFCTLAIDGNNQKITTNFTYDRPRLGWYKTVVVSMVDLSCSWLNHLPLTPPANGLDDGLGQVPTSFKSSMVLVVISSYPRGSGSGPRA
mmetsp:Transcript_651/g.1931  ORF Transcript_651/g.1931 Transcript_651/m.1931 type:complete len:156 (-) Transcript_651:376-843(-)